MPKVKITSHMVVKNEDRFIYYAINSVLPFVDRLFITDTGSSDKTLQIIKLIRNNKISFESKNINGPNDISKIRNNQLAETATDWFWVVDGDEVYPQSLVKEILKLLEERGDSLEGIVVGRYDLLGDIYHYQSESVGTYNLFGRHGHYILRLLNKKRIPGLHVAGDYPNEGYYDQDGIPIIKHSPDKYKFTKGRIFHAMYLRRSTLGANLNNTFNRRKEKIELGIPMTKKVPLPEVFKLPHPKYVPDILNSRSVSFTLAAGIITPIKIVKRKIWQLLIEKQ